MTTKTVVVRLHAATSAYQAAMAKASLSTKELARNITGVGDTSDQHLKRIGRGALLAAGGLTLGLGLSAKAAIDWESAWAGVTKTVEGSDAQLSSLQEGLRGLAGELPATHAEIAGVAEVAGQLGVSVGGIEKFTDTMIDLGETTNLTAEQAATGLARIANIMGTAERDVERMGSTIVELGNNSATTEAEILELATRLAAAGRIAGLSEADVFAFASTLTSVGVEAEAGGTALSKVFTSIRDAVLDGGDDLETFASVAGVTVDQFSAAFRDDAAGAVALFIDGLGRMNASGRSTTQVFDDLKLTDQRLMRALLSTASAGDLLTDSLELGAKAWEENTALQTEAEKRYETTSAQLEIARNKVVDFGIDVGSILLPAINGAIDVFGNFADGLASLPGPAAGGIAAMGGLSAATLGAVGVLGVIGPKVREAKAALEGMGSIGASFGNNLGKISGSLAAVGAAIGAGVLIYELASRAGREYAESVTEVKAALSGVVEGQVDLNEAMRAIFDSEFDKIAADNISTLTDLGLTLGDLEDSVRSGGDALDPLRAKFAELGIEFDETTGRVTALDEATNTALGEMGTHAGAVNTLNDAVEDLDNTLQDGTRDTLERAVADGVLEQAELDAAVAANTAADGTVNYSGALKDLAPTTTAAANEMKTFSSAAEIQADSIDSVSDAIDAMMDAFDALIGVNISAMEANLDVIEGFEDLTAAFKVNGATLDANSEAGRENTRTLNDQVGSILADIEARRRDNESIDSVTAAALRHVEALKETMRQADFTEEQISSYIDELGLTPDNIETRVALSGVNDAEQALNTLARQRTASIIAEVKAGRTGPLFGHAPSETNNRWGGLTSYAAGGIHSYAMGGITPAHITNRELIKYGEPPTAAETYVPPAAGRLAEMLLEEITS